MAKVFSLEGKALKLDTRDDIVPLLKDLVPNDDVEEFILQGNTIGIEASEALAEVLLTKTSLKTANLADIYTTRLIEEIPPSLTIIFSSLLPHQNLTTVNLSDNAFGARTEAPLVSFLSSHTPLQHLILNNNGLGPTCGAAIANALTQLAAKKKEVGTPIKLETVVCGRNRLENGSMEAWAKAYAANSGIKTVRMLQNGIRTEGIQHLLREGLKHCKELEILDLQDNTFTFAGATALAEVVTEWTAIKELGVGDCLLSSRGAEALSESLRKGKNTELKILRLQYNEIEVNGVNAIKWAVKASLEKLELLELNGNKFSEDDDVVAEIRDIFEERGLGELDELSDMEEETDEEEEEEEEEEEKEREEIRERVVKDAERAEESNVAQEKDSKVDELAEALGRATI
ncbi:hypothetical protein ABW19_dt0207021 [Dactylella cylindrospora]|nr:hypothetical protein ABW19_dt0207021 [Dactylella cylindrospora]